ncbi:MAG: efflux transporter periplasmic adaptor subunit, partial [Flammeovirgaceae bacterium]|nr:efflux transporter periplasmic adaptor subunit [Flammeovirgaceae bacterium]
MKLRQLFIVLGMLGIIAGAFALSRFLASQRKEPQRKNAVLPKKYVKTQPVRYTDIPTEIVAYGRVSSAQPLDLIAEVAGRLKQGDVLLKAGQKFHKGDLLFSTDDAEARLTLQANKSTFMKLIASILPDLKIDHSASYDAWNQ